jgi:hypothetical protein
MRHTLIIALVGALPLLTGCNQLLKPLLNSGHTVGNSVSDPSSGVVVAMGQSNMVGVGGKSPAVGFATETNKTVVNCAVIGTTLDEWRIGGALDQACAAQISGRRVVGILFYQGEQDAKNGQINWNGRFKTTAEGWRARWGQNVPIVYAQLATADFSFGWGTVWNQIKAEQANVTLFKSRMVVTEDLPLRDDIHLTGDACMEVGRRMAQALTTL